VTRAAARIRCFRKNTAGTIIVFAALGMPIAIGGMGLGAEVGYWYYTQRLLQHAADTAAHGAGVRRRQGDSQSELEAVALDLATNGGFDGTSALMTLNNPPLSGPRVGNSRAVEVVLTTTLPRMFSSIFNNTPVVVSARAVSLFNDPTSACVLALAPNVSSALEASGNGSAGLDCHSASNSMANDSFNMQGSADFTTRCVHTVGKGQPTAGLTLTECGAVNELSPMTPDPYADVPMPLVKGPCNPKSLGNPQSDVTVWPDYHHHQTGTTDSKRFCTGLQLMGNVHFKPGIYIIEGGDLTANAGAKITGDGVTFFFTNGAQSRLNGTAELHLSPPTSGLFSGILFFGDRTEPALSHHVNGGSLSTFEGAIYFPSQRIIYNGGAGTGTGCTQIIGYTINFSGDSGVALNCDGVGTKDIEVGGTVVIAE
jgi:hypothetical protein